MNLGCWGSDSLRVPALSDVALRIVGRYACEICCCCLAVLKGVHYKANMIQVMVIVM